MKWPWRYVGAKWEFWPHTKCGPTNADWNSTHTLISGKAIGNHDAQYLINFYSSDGKLVASIPPTGILGGTSFSISTSEEVYEQLVLYGKGKMGALQGWLEVLTTEEMALECHVEYSYTWEAPPFGVEGYPEMQHMEFWRTYPVPLVLDTLRGFRAFVWLRSRAPFRLGRQ